MFPNLFGTVLCPVIVPSDVGESDLLLTFDSTDCSNVCNPAPKQTECLLFVDFDGAMLPRRSPIIARETGDLQTK